MHNRQLSQSNEYDAEFYLKVTASLFIACVTATVTAAMYANRDYLYLKATNLKNNLTARFFAPKPNDTAPTRVITVNLGDPTLPASALYGVVNAKLDTGALGAEQKPSSELDTEAPTTPTPSAEVAPSLSPEAKTADQKESESPDVDDDFVDLAGEELETPGTTPTKKVEEPERSNSPRPR
jgi:hypothetical protein